MRIGAIFTELGLVFTEIGYSKHVFEVRIATFGGQNHDFEG